MKKYLSLIGITALVLIIGWVGYQALFAYLAEHTYYFWMLSSGQNWWVFASALLFACLPLLYLFLSSKLKVRNLIIRFIVWAWVFGLVHSNIKWELIWIWHIVTIFNTVLLVCLWIYLILWFSAIWSWIERKWIKFSQFRWQEIFLTFWIWFCSFVIIVQILMLLVRLYYAKRHVHLSGGARERRVLLHEDQLPAGQQVQLVVAPQRPRAGHGRHPLHLRLRKPAESRPAHPWKSAERRQIRHEAHRHDVGRLHPGHAPAVPFFRRHDQFHHLRVLQLPPRLPSESDGRRHARPHRRRLPRHDGRRHADVHRGHLPKCADRTGPVT